MAQIPLQLGLPDCLNLQQDPWQVKSTDCWSFLDRQGFQVASACSRVFQCFSVAFSFSGFQWLPALASFSDFSVAFAACFCGGFLRLSVAFTCFCGFQWLSKAFSCSF